MNRVNPSTNSTTSSRTMPHEKFSIPAPDSSNVSSCPVLRQDAPRVMRPSRIFRIPVRLPVRFGKLGFHTTPAKRSVTSKPATIPETKRSPLDPFGRRFCGASKSGKTANFIAAHIGAPCTVGALDHQLSCGHKISTGQPEPCASNCKRSNGHHAGPELEPFVCITCIVDDVKARHDAKVEEFWSEMEAIASVARKDLEREDLARRLQVVEIGWQELDLKEIRERVACGRWSQPFYVDTAYLEAVEIIMRDHNRSGIAEAGSTSSTSSSIVQRGHPEVDSDMGSLPSSRSSSPASLAWATGSNARSSKLPKRS